MNVGKMKKAVKIVHSPPAIVHRVRRPLLEASGGINLGNVKEVAKTGVDMISVGALTHSAKGLDINLDIRDYIRVDKGKRGTHETSGEENRTRCRRIVGRNKAAVSA